ncbi:hypothetical protein [Mesorhizobium sp. LNHC209A00]|uniref:hypothetical protein n=1 Tax=Mesorhizobium sp. LNHC209A00 TaxID=1287226 RepID=UPI0003D02863|nr:hypothetical protein [Mesorhizobium sp. LNHC209A00]ESY92411.1 hypothetical protein X738_27150 [Mesorhizobium sp. LNHC209A00]
MRDAEKPRPQRLPIVEQLDLAIGLEQRLLHDVLAIQRRAGHARAIAMQPGAQMRNRLQERGIAQVEHAVGLGRGPHALRRVGGFADLLVHRGT